VKGRAPFLDLSALLQAWPLPKPWQISSLAQGTNNLVLRVETCEGSYVMRVYSNHADLGRLGFEHSVLTRLQVAGLPFALPAPLPTTAGKLHTCVPTDAGEALATLTPLLPGAHPKREDLAQAYAAGEALGVLDMALARITLPNADEGVTWRSYGDLAHCHPLVPDPRAALQELPVAYEARQRLVERYDWLIERIPRLYATLPLQLAHEDYAPDNLLMAGARVTAVLDFEFCARDLLAMDLTVALSWWPVEQLGTGGEWPIMRAVASGYARHATLSDEEIKAIPVLYELRAYTSLIHRLGRHRQGLSSLEAVTERAEAALERHDWLRAHGERLIQTLREAMDAP
jgi:Ser/Thr protein kinase RdoA (MazF antagonist)